MPGDLAPRAGFRPSLAGAGQERAQVAVARVLERQAVEDAVHRAHQRKRVEDANRARMSVEQLAEVRLAQPAVDARADLDADDLRDDRRAAEPRGEIDLTEAALAEQPFDAVLEPRFRAADDLARRQQIPRAVEPERTGVTLRVVAAVACFNMGNFGLVRVRLYRTVRLKA